MMAAERGGGPGSPLGSQSDVADYSLLVVVGALRPTGLLDRLLRQIDSGELCQSSPVPETLLGRSAGREVCWSLHNKTTELLKRGQILFLG